mgnify:CR=1 FL=1
MGCGFASPALFPNPLSQTSQDWLRPLLAGSHADWMTSIPHRCWHASSIQSHEVA